ncbi:MAG TPA: potassium-transporting ATPase subunit F [Planctomycetota bacterium]|nr:potassium-transporting ATPase subunit F [Planctomycetota bacterium]
MTLDQAIGLAVSGLVTAYLVVALLRPEWFE